MGYHQVDSAGSMGNAPQHQLDQGDSAQPMSDLDREMQELLAQGEQEPVSDPEQLDLTLLQSPHSAELDSILNSPEEPHPTTQFEPASPPVVTEGDLANANLDPRAAAAPAVSTHHEHIPIATEAGIDQLIASVEKTLGELATPMNVPSIENPARVDSVADAAIDQPESLDGPAATVSVEPVPAPAPKVAVPATIEALDATLAQSAEQELARKQAVDVGTPESSEPASVDTVTSVQSAKNESRPSAKPLAQSESRAEPGPIKRENRPSWFLTVFDPAVRRVVAKASAPLASRPPAVRRVVGYISINTLLMGACLWGYAIFVRPQQLAVAHSVPFNFETSGLPVPGAAGDHAALDDHGTPATSHASQASSKGTSKDSGKDTQAKEKKSDGHAKDDKAKARPSGPLLSGSNKYLINDRLSAKKDKPKEAKGGGH